MITWNERLYTDGKVHGRLKVYMREAKKKRSLKKFYLITMPAHPENCLDIYESRQLWLNISKNRKDKPLEVVGIASGEEETADVLRKIAEDVIKEEGTFDSRSVRSFFGKVSAER